MRGQPIGPGGTSSGEAFAPPEKDKLVTDNLLMEFVSEGDGDRMFSKFGEELFEKWGVKDETAAELKEGLRNSRDLAIGKKKTLLDLAVHEKMNRAKIIGRCGIFPNRKKNNGEYRINLWLDTPGAQTKYAVEIVERLVQWAREFNKTRPGIINYLTFPVVGDSPGAKKVVEKLGLTSGSNKLGIETTGEGEEEKDVTVYRVPLG